MTSINITTSRPTTPSHQLLLQFTNNSLRISISNKKIPQTISQQIQSVDKRDLNTKVSLQEKAHPLDFTTACSNYIDMESLTPPALDFEKESQSSLYESLSDKSPESGSKLPQSKKIKKEAPKTPKTPSTEDDQPKGKFEKKEKKEKSRWTPALDAQVVGLLAKHGTRWTDIGRMIGGKTGKQVRDRYLQKLRPNINFEKWTKEEDAQIMALYKKLGNRWCQIAEHLVNRTENQVKNRFHAKLKRLISPNQEQETRNDRPECDLAPIVELESLEELEKDYTGTQNSIDLIDFENIYITKNETLPDFERLNSMSILKHNSVISRFYRDEPKEGEEWSFF